MPNTTQSEPFSALAEVYTVAGFARYGEMLMPRLMDLVFSQDWVGRSILDLGCGTGEIACQLAADGYRVFALDSSPTMLRLAQAHAQPMGLSIDWVQADMRRFTIEAAADLAFCVGGTLNLLPTLADLETTFRQVYAALDAGKLFIFDLRTVRGLAASGGRDAIIFDDGENVMVVARTQFSYEILSLTTTYHILTAGGGEWRRATETHLERGYPYEAIRRTLLKTGFRLLKTLNLSLEQAEPSESDQLLFLAQREGG